MIALIDGVVVVVQMIFQNDFVKIVPLACGLFVK